MPGVARAAARWALVVIFAWSSGGKLLAPRQFAGLLAGFGMFPEAILKPLAVALPSFELSIALAVASGRFASLGAVGGITLTTAFIGVHAYALWFGVVVPCGCAGVSISPASRGAHGAMLLVSVLALASSVTVLFSAPRPGSADDSGVP